MHQVDSVFVIGLLSLSVDMCPTGDIFFSMKTIKETRCRLKQNCWKQGLSRLKLSSVKPVWQELLLLFFCVVASELRLWLRFPASLLPGMQCCARACREKPVSVARGQPASLKHYRRFHTKMSPSWDCRGLFCWGGGKHRHWMNVGAKRRQGLGFEGQGGLTDHCCQ